MAVELLPDSSVRLWVSKLVPVTSTLPLNKRNAGSRTVRSVRSAQDRTRLLGPLPAHGFDGPNDPRLRGVSERGDNCVLEFAYRVVVNREQRVEARLAALAQRRDGTRRDILFGGNRLAGEPNQTELCRIAPDHGRAREAQEHHGP